MEPESYQKTGRGGAGNFYSKHDIEEASKHTAEVSKGNAQNSHTDTTTPYLLLELPMGFLIAHWIFSRIWKHKAKPLAPQ